MRAATVVQVLQDLFYVSFMFYFTCDRSLNSAVVNDDDEGCRRCCCCSSSVFQDDSEYVQCVRRRVRLRSVLDLCPVSHIPVAAADATDQDSRIRVR